MGNKDKGKREAKKPKKSTPKLAPPRREEHQFTPNIPKRPTDSN
jgi:hypothetical protein